MILMKIMKGYIPNKGRKILTVSDDMIDDMFNKKKLQQIVTYLFIRSRKLKVFLVQPNFTHN